MARYRIHQPGLEQNLAFLFKVLGKRRIARHHDFPDDSFTPGSILDKTALFSEFFETLFVEAEPADIKKLAAVPGITIVEENLLKERLSPPLVPTARVASNWGLGAVGVTAGGPTGAGVKVAVLDGGFDVTHPDLAGRIPAAQHRDFTGLGINAGGKFHGTQVAGVIAARPDPQGAPIPRYSVAPGVDLFLGRVSINGSISNIGLQPLMFGIDWALSSGCRIINLSLGWTSNAFGPWPYREKAREALVQRNVLIIAAAGNNSNRPTALRPVEEPADAREILAVGAVDSSRQLHPKTATAGAGAGAEVNLVGPGANISSPNSTELQIPGSIPYALFSQTSAAAAFVTGVAALILQGNPMLTGPQLWAALEARAQPLPLPPQDVGRGLVHV